MTLVGTDDLKTWKWSTDLKTGLSLYTSHSSVCLYLEFFVGGHMSHIRCVGLPKVVPSTYCVVFFFSFSSSCTLIFIYRRVNLIMIHAHFFWQYDLWVSVILIVNGVSPYISHITKYTGLRQFEKCYNVISPMFLFNCPNFDLWYLHFYKNGHVSL